MPLARFGVSLDENLLKALDNFVVENNLPNRSQAIRYLVEKSLAEKKMALQSNCGRRSGNVYDHITR